MHHTYQKLKMRPLNVNTVVFRYAQGLPASVEMNDAALTVMTDLTRVKVFTVTTQTFIDDALQKMIHAEVRLLVVTDASDTVLGLITANDIMGERPVSISTAEGIPHSAIQVAQIMTPREAIDALRMKDVEEARVGDIVATLRSAGRQHAIVLDEDDHGRAILRGIFSTSQIARQLGVVIEPDGKAQTFAELERALHVA